MKGELTVRVFNQEEYFTGMRERWNTLLRHSAADTIFLSWEWCWSWWKNFKQPNQVLFILEVTEEDKLKGIAPFYITTIPYLKSQIRRIDFISFGTVDAEYLDFIIEKGNERPVLKAVFDYLLDHQGEWNFIYLGEIPENAVTIPILKELASAHHLSIRSHRHDCAYVPLPDNFDTYINSMGYNFRKKLRHFTKRLEKGHTVEFIRTQSPENLQTDLESLFRLHQKHWQSEHFEGSFLNPQRRGFYHDMAGLFMENDWLRLYSLRVDGQYTAHQYAFEYNNKLFALQDGYDPDWGDKRVARVLRGYVFKQCIEKGLYEYDFLREISDHKRNWEAIEKYSIDFTIGRTNFTTRMYLNVPVYVKQFRKGLRKLIPVQVMNLRSRIKERRALKSLEEKIQQQEQTGDGH